MGRAGLTTTHIAVLTVATGLLVGAAARPVMAAPPAGSEAAVDRQAVEAFAAGRYDEARDLYARLFADSCARRRCEPTYLRNIARCHQKKRDPGPALDKFREYLRLTGPLPAHEQQEIDGYIAEMEALRDEQAAAAAAATARADADRQRQDLTRVDPEAATKAEARSRRRSLWIGVGIAAAILAGVGIAVAVAGAGGSSDPTCPDGYRCVP